MVSIKKMWLICLISIIQLFEHSLRKTTFDLLQIENIYRLYVVTTSIRRKKYVTRQIFVVNWSNFGTKECQIFSIHTVTVKKLVCSVYLYLGYDFLHEYTDKVHLFADINYLWLIFDICQENVVFVYFS